MFLFMAQQSPPSKLQPALLVSSLQKPLPTNATLAQPGTKKENNIIMYLRDRKIIGIVQGNIDIFDRKIQPMQHYHKMNLNMKVIDVLNRKIYRIFSTIKGFCLMGLFGLGKSCISQKSH